LAVWNAMIGTLLAAGLMAGSARADSTALLSIQGVTVDDAHHLTEIVIKTWGVEVLAVCHIPPVSVVSVDFDLDPGGTLVWKARSWHGELERSDLKELASLFLVRVAEYQKEPRGDPHGDYHPATFAGVATISRIEDPPRARKVRLRWNNFVLTPAARCPDPAPAP
jgi:hypothetical protein